MVMIFANSLVRGYLMKHGMVYTYRKNHRKTSDGIRPQVGRDWATDKRTGKKIADINITPMEPVDSQNMRQVLTKYIYKSGFATGFGFVNLNLSVNNWVRAIQSLNPFAHRAGWIYKVEVIK